jgi:methylated-DNA-[protein]-cysteine S-methyltransferase
MRSIVKSSGVRAELTRYGVDGWGKGELWTADGVVLAHDFDFDVGSAAEDARGPATDLVDLVRRFLAGEDVVFADVRLDVGEVTPFQQAIVDALRRVPRGEVLTYGELAAAAGYPKAQRAAGNVCAHNPFMFFLPCHRIVSASGIGSYGSAGLAVKRRLLALEGIDL